MSNWKLPRPNPDKVPIRNKDGLLECPLCGRPASYGKCSSRKCGWKSTTRLQREAKNPRKPYTRKFPNLLDIFPRHETAPTYNKPILKRTVFTEGGEVFYDEYQCPECKGKGWSLNYNVGCSLCHGLGVISGERQKIFNRDKK